MVGVSGLAALSLSAPFLNFTGVAHAAEPVRGGKLTVAQSNEPASLDPIMGNAQGTDRSVYNLFAENLLYQDDKGEFHPQLAESWTLAEDGKSLIFKLRPGVKFQDGTDFNAEAVKFNLDRVIDPKVAARARQYIGDLESTEVIDPLTVKINLKQPSGPFLTALATEPGSMVSPTAVRERGADFARSPIGTGPFQITDWGAGKVEAKRFDGYWGGAPYLDTVTVRTISNTAVKLVELKSGSVQLGDTIQVKDIPDLESDPNLKLVDKTQVLTAYMAFNNSKPPFNNINLRKAVSHAISREALEKAVSRGQGGVMSGLEAPVSPVWSEEIKGHNLNLELAREAYKKSGHKGPLTLLVIQRDPDTQIAQMIQSMCKAAGIDLRISVLERLAWVERTTNGNFELGLLRGGSPGPDPDMLFSQFYGRNASNDYARILNPEVWDMVDQARRLSNMADRKKIYVAIQQKILDNYWQTYLFWRPQKEITAKNLQGFDREYSGGWRYNKMWLAAEG
jgi:peptide/nickel transport system substrate-binding protein